MMRNFCSVVLVLALVVFCAACGATVSGNKILANETAKSLQQFLVKGKTTQQEVVAKFGKPDGSSLFDGKEVWTYTYTHVANASPGYLVGFAPVIGSGLVGGAIPSTTDATGKNLQITFSKSGVVEKFDYTELTDNSVNVGI